MLTGIALIIGICLLCLSRDFGNFEAALHLTIAMASAAFFFDLSKSKRLKTYALPLSLGYLFRLALLYYDVYSGDLLHLPLVGGPLDSDPLRFYTAAVALAGGRTVRYGGSFSRLFGWIFSVTGDDRLWGQFVVMMFSVASLCVLGKILDELDVSETARVKSMLMVCLLPNCAFLSVIFRRETIIMFFIAVSLLYYLRWAKGGAGDSAFVAAVVFALLASLFHGATGLIALGYLAVRIAYNPKTKVFTLKAVNVITGVVLVGAFLVIYSRYGEVFFNKLERVDEGIETIASMRDAGGSSYAQYVGDSRTPLRMLLFAVPRFMYYMFSPFPWQWRGVSDIITFLLSSCVYLLILINSVRYIRRRGRQDPNRSLLIAVLIPALLMAIVFSWGVTNTGTATRHRDKFLVLYAVMFALNYPERIRLLRSSLKPGQLR